jgi:hypothetical protein
MPVAIQLSEQEQERFRRSHRWSAAIKASLLAGAIVWLFPAGNPWTSFSQRTGAQIMGRPISTEPITQLSWEAVPAHLGHFAYALVCGFIILGVVYRLRSWRAILAGIITGLVIYGINFAAFHFLAPQFTGRYEFDVIVAHVLFSGITAGVIRGFLRPPMRVDESQPNAGARYP